MREPDREAVRVITPEQLSEGYETMTRAKLDGMPMICKHQYEVVRRLSDGNYLVKEPRR